MTTTSHLVFHCNHVAVHLAGPALNPDEAMSLLCGVAAIIWDGDTALGLPAGWTCKQRHTASRLNDIIRFTRSPFPVRTVSNRAAA